MQQDIKELKEKWKSLWGITPHKFIGQAMLEKSIAYKEQELLGEGLTKQHKERLDILVKQYKRNPNCFDDGRTPLKPGTRLVKNWQGKRHTVLVKSTGFDYNGTHYRSLSTIANTITGSRWNGYLFFGLKK